MSIFSKTPVAALTVQLSAFFSNRLGDWELKQKWDSSCIEVSLTMLYQASGIIPRQSVDSEVKILSCQWDKTFILSYKNLKIVIHVFPEPCLRACLSWRWKHCPTAPPDYWGKGQKEHDVWSINLYCEIQFKVSFMLQNICFRDLAGSPFDPPFQQL